MLDRTQLSQRENQVLEYAVQGLSDREIAQRMELSPATVNSYWVRIRGKLGHLSRTEFVGQLLRQESEATISTMLAAHERTQAIADERIANRAALKMAHFYKDSLEAVPEPLVVLEAGGVIEFANDRACTLFGCRKSELEGKDIRFFFPKNVAFNQAQALQGALRANEQTTLGLRSVFYVKRTGDGDLRVLLVLNPTNSHHGRITVCLVKPFLEEVEKRRDRAAAMATLHRQ